MSAWYHSPVRPLRHIYQAFPQFSFSSQKVSRRSINATYNLVLFFSCRFLVFTRGSNSLMDPTAMADEYTSSIALTFPYISFILLYQTHHLFYPFPPASHHCSTRCSSVPSVINVAVTCTPASLLSLDSPVFVEISYILTPLSYFLSYVHLLILLVL